ncbi:acetyl-CoA carboxylase biotin carboxyl carrier protein subunit [Anditalea andensis]|uniref:Carboxylesterase n=1 Tax=Anditalea andensis TaxID=1048983 RepID=A0A074LME6_9BACT|nr:acetyl-CoA carboxylase biotin carboxyl carrier protein subunit [Anditalea andensis]KEO75057.1 carboxylesterase [Anditalea andensis]
MYSVVIDKNQYQVSREGDSYTINGTTLEWDIIKIKDRIYHIIIGDRSHTLELISSNEEEKTLNVKLDHKITTLIVKDRYDQLLEKLGMNLSAGNKVKDIKAPMPGLIFEIKVKVGDLVKKGDPVLVLEAMKMENILKSPGDGEVKEIKVSKGASVEKNQVLIQF